MINQRGIDLIKSFEQCRLKAYHGAADADGVFTIGWGHVITGFEKDTHGIELFRPGQRISECAITQQMADELFEADIKIFEKGLRLALNKEIMAKLSSDQFSAMASLVFNIGLGAFRNSSTLRKVLLESGDVVAAGKKGFKGWIRSNNKVQSGLIRRRAAEMALYFSEYGAMDRFMHGGTKDVPDARRYLGI